MDGMGEGERVRRNYYTNVFVGALLLDLLFLETTIYCG